MKSHGRHEPPVLLRLTAGEWTVMWTSIFLLRRRKFLWYVREGGDGDSGKAVRVGGWGVEARK